MPLIQVDDILNSDDFSQAYSINRSIGAFALGGYQSVTTVIPMWGPIQPADSESLEMVPEGDRVNGAVEFLSQQIIYETNGAASLGASGISDTITWNGQLYRIVSVKPWRDNGYYRAVGTRMSGV